MAIQFFYSLSFGGFVGLTSYLSIFFLDQYGVDKVTAGDFVTFIVLAGSCARPIGGYLGDRYSGLSLIFGYSSGLSLPSFWSVFFPAVCFASFIAFDIPIFRRSQWSRLSSDFRVFYERSGISDRNRWCGWWIRGILLA